ncbi:uncharacterized protein EV420DRAFT_1473268 [Desarmillaria tabescens]|uniref:Uncharacterized protein n=1 Tax=Armillaria tabescens TaxID=1929756 RepID=A0AA39NQV1_ARMTA|nr:uncharacterized protein EV420DRAFT_1473268 [Desarmillaria tabescens]KAK0470182.1 hypothetical protein EV420DRAFT_1473268 [Desarmillaria tabescens]
MDPLTSCLFLPSLIFDMPAQTSVLLLYCQGYTYAIKTTNVGNSGVHHVLRYWDGLRKGSDGTSMCNIFHFRIRFQKVYRCVRFCVEHMRSIQYPGSAGRTFGLDSEA